MQPILLPKRNAHTPKVRRSSLSGGWDDGELERLTFGVCAPFVRIKFLHEDYLSTQRLLLCP